MSLYRTLLLVDDDSEDQEIFLDAIKEIDPSIHCFFAGNGEAALTLLQGDVIDKPDMLFVDMNMPKMNGKRVLQEVKKINDLQHIPVVMYSTFFGPADVEEIISSGAAHYMVKSTRFTDLCDALRNVLEKKW